MPTILSIQSSVAYGHAGNSAAVFPLMRLGVEVWPVLTVHFSNHTGYGSWEGIMFTPAEVAAVVRGIDDRGVLTRCDAVLSGYQGAEEMGLTILDAVALVKQRNPRALYCCDPVMGDVDTGLYVEPGIPDLMRDQVIPAADVVTPNHFELTLLTGHDASTLAEVLEAADSLRARGPRTVLVTSVRHTDAAPGTVEMIAVGEQGAFRVVTPHIDRYYSGSGDMTTAVFLASLLDQMPLDQALARTAASVYGVLRVTGESGSDELQLVAAQDELVHPTRTFEVTRLR